MGHIGREWLEKGRRRRSDGVLPDLDVWDCIVRAKRLHGRPTRAQVVDLVMMHVKVRESSKAGNRDWADKRFHNFVSNFFHDDPMVDGLEARGVWAVPQGDQYAVIEFFDELTADDFAAVVAERRRDIANEVERLEKLILAYRFRPFLSPCSPPHPGRRTHRKKK